MKRYDYYDNELEMEDTKNSAYHETEGLPLCGSAFSSEIYRFDDVPDVCDDGRSGM